MANDEHKAIVHAVMEAMMSDDPTRLDDLLAPECVLHQCGLLEPIRGAAAITGRRVGRFLSDPQVQLERLVSEGDLIAVHWRTSGHYANPNRPSKSGQPISFGSMSFLRLDGGKIQEIWNIQDMSTVAAQLGWED